MMSTSASRRNLFAHLLSSLMLLIASKVEMGGAKDDNLCQGKPADVMFLLDGSGSILPLDFQRQLDFVKDVIDVFDVTSDVKTQVGVASFSNWAFQDFHLNSYSSVESMKKAVDRIRQIHGDTNTAAALAHIQDVSFRETHGARPGIPHIAIVLTDGRSNVPIDTINEARRAKQTGIHIFAIGVGDDVDNQELRALASSPTDQHVFMVHSYSALTYIKDMLAIETCKVTDVPTTLPPPTTTKLDQVCGDARLVDIVFSTSPSVGVADTEKALQFYKSIVNELPLHNDNIHIGMVPKHCEDLPDIQVTDDMDKDALMEQLDREENSGPQLSDVVHYMRKISFSEKQGARNTAKRKAVLMVDKSHPNFTKTLRDAGKMRIMSNVEIFVVGIGESVEAADLEMLATSPATQHVFHVSGYHELHTIAEKVRRALCPVASA